MSSTPPVTSTVYPPAVAQAFEVLKNELVWLHHRWATYNQLYGKDERRIELLNHVAPGFFFVVQESVYDAVVLSVCRMCDPPETGRAPKAQANMTLRRLLQEVVAAGDAVLAASLETKWAEIRSALPQLVEYRHKHVGHLDFDVAVKKASLAGPSREQVNVVLTLIGEFLNQVCRSYGDTTWLFDSLVVDGDPEQLLRTAKAGLRYFELMDAEAIPFDDDPRGKWGDS